MVKTLKIKVRHEAYPWLNKAAVEVNHVRNRVGELHQYYTQEWGRTLTWRDHCDALAGATKDYSRIGADVIQLIACEYPEKLKIAKSVAFSRLKCARTPEDKARASKTVARLMAGKLRWRKSYGAHRSLGWIPFKTENLRPTKTGKITFYGKHIRVFEPDRMPAVVEHPKRGKRFNIRDSCFTQDACRDWYLCLVVEVPAQQGVPAPCEEVGIDLGLKAIATTSEGDVLEHGRWFACAQEDLAYLQRRASWYQRRNKTVPRGIAKRIAKLHRKVARQRADALHKASRRIIERYQRVAVGNVSSRAIGRTRLSKSVHDAGWGMFKSMLLYKGQQTGRMVFVVDEKYTSRACSSCGALAGPKGVNGLDVRQWMCRECGVTHDRDINAARNILARSRSGAPSADSHPTG
jgi:putative transposase